MRSEPSWYSRAAVPVMVPMPCTMCMATLNWTHQSIAHRVWLDLAQFGRNWLDVLGLAQFAGMCLNLARISGLCHHAKRCSTASPGGEKRDSGMPLITLIMSFLTQSPGLHSRIHRDCSPSRPARPTCRHRIHVHAMLETAVAGASLTRTCTAA